MHVEDILTGMRSGNPQPDAAIEAFVAGVTDGSISRPQAAAWLAWAFRRTLNTQETVALTRAMTKSGHVMRWPEGPTLIDKHSTGGVGDKVSLVLAPLWAELGLRVPMVSGRGLGHTGGTLDKLEAIEGFRTDLNERELDRVLAEVGCFISGQTAELAPADRVMYALRNEIQAVESIPLIVGSILSKKLAEGVQRLVLDVKTGSGAFMQKYEDSERLARAMVDVAKGYGVSCMARITAMDRPLGVKVGNGLEVEESIDALKGGGPDDLREITLAFAEHPDAARVLASGAAYERFARMVRAQGVSLDKPLRGSGVTKVVVEATHAGILQAAHARDLGRAAFVLGAGRRRAEDPVDFGVGLEVFGRPGAGVERGQPLCAVWHRNGHALGEALSLVQSAMPVGEEPVAVSPLIQALID